MPYDLRRNTNPGRRVVRPIDYEPNGNLREDADMFVAMAGPPRARIAPARPARPARPRRPAVEELSTNDLNGMVAGRLGRTEEDTARGVPAALARERIRQTMGLKKGGPVRATKKAAPKKKVRR